MAIFLKGKCGQTVTFCPIDCDLGVLKATDVYVVVSGNIPRQWGTEKHSRIRGRPAPGRIILANVYSTQLWITSPNGGFHLHKLFA